MTTIGAGGTRFTVRGKVFGATPTSPISLATRPLALMTINIGNVLSADSRESMAAAADRWGADFVEFTRPIKNVGGKPHWQKAFLHGSAAASGFDRVVYFDADVLIRSDAPSPFDVTPRERVGVVADIISYPPRKPGTFKKDHQLWSEYFKIKLPADAHLNAGIIVFTVGEHREVFDDWVEAGRSQKFGRAAKLVDEVALSAVLHKRNLAHWLPATWNWLAVNPATPPGNMKEFVYHYAGMKAKKIVRHRWKFVRGRHGDGRPVVATMATHLGRRHVVQHAVESIARQVDLVRLYVNDYDELAFTPPANVRVLRGADLGDAGKFFEIEHLDGYVLTCDDDLIYPPDYAQKMVAAVDRYGRVVVTIHGTIIRGGHPGYSQMPFTKPLNKDAVVNMAGTGVSAFDTRHVRIKLDDFPVPNAADAQLAWFCQQQRIPVVSIAKMAGWVKEVPRSQNKDAIKFMKPHPHEQFYDGRQWSVFPLAKVEPPPPPKVEQTKSCCGGN